MRLGCFSSSSTQITPSSDIGFGKEMEAIASKLQLEVVKQAAVDSTTYTRGSTLAKTLGDHGCSHKCRAAGTLTFLQTSYPPNLSTTALEVSDPLNPKCVGCMCSCLPQAQAVTVPAKACKHVVASLLFFIRSPRSFLPSPESFGILEASFGILPEVSKGKDDEGEQGDDQREAKVSKKRVLPAWMTGGPLETKKPRLKHNDLGEEKVELVYAMLEHELLAAAVEYLKSTPAFAADHDDDGEEERSTEGRILIEPEEDDYEDEDEDEE